jgi:anti-sigma regulatory factor (Ser/Thr protein kinase)
MPKHDFSIRADVAELKTVTSEVVRFLQRHGVPGTAAYFTRLAVEELVVNVIRHAFEEGGDEAISISLDLDEERLQVCIEDGGRAFDPTRVPAPDLSGPLEVRRAGGWGVYLVRSVSERMTYERHGDRNRVTVAIRLDVRSGRRA